MKNQNGFTLIELMIVIAIIGILLAIAIPAYSDYTVRAKVTECINGLAPLKTGVSEYVISNGKYPSNVNSIGTAFSSKYCALAGLAASGGILSIVSTASTGGTTVKVQMKPTTDAAGSVIWVCSVASGTAKYAPSSCR